MRGDDNIGTHGKPKTKSKGAALNGRHHDTGKGCKGGVNATDLTKPRIRPAGVLWFFAVTPQREITSHGMDNDDIAFTWRSLENLGRAAQHFRSKGVGMRRALQKQSPDPAVLLKSNHILSVSANIQPDCLVAEPGTSTGETFLRRLQELQAQGVELDKALCIALVIDRVGLKRHMRFRIETVR